MKYLFWNTHKNTCINKILCDLIIENDISIAIMAEYSANIDELLKKIHYAGRLMQEAGTIGCERIKIIKAQGISMEPQLQTDHSSIQIIGDDIILCSVHFNSRIYADHFEQREIRIEEIIDEILKLEKEVSTKNTIIVGDFNINPYDSSCLSARYFHGIPVYEDAMRKVRTVAGKEFHMFYNPMWNFLGDFKEPYGTYYYNSGNTVNPYWNIFDQVIIRPDLRKRFVDDSLKIITQTNRYSLIDEQKHPDCTISDHLPITFEIKEEENE